MRCPTITNSFLQQEYPTYTILGQSQYQTCYSSSGFGVVPPADSNTESMALATTTYPAEKPNALVPARVVQRPSSGEAGSVKDDCKIPLLNSAGGRCGETSPKGTYRHLFMLGQMGHLPSLSNWSHWCAEYYGGPAILMYQKPSTGNSRTPAMYSVCPRERECEGSLEELPAAAPWGVHMGLQGSCLYSVSIAPAAPFSPAARCSEYLAAMT